jgi:hypothetical protein
MQPLDAAASGAIRAMLERQPTTSGKVAFAWSLAAGPSLARASAVEWLPDGTLAVRARSDAWRLEIVRARPLITARLDALLGADVVRRLTVSC